MDLLLGFGTGTFDVQLAFTLQGVNGYLGGGAAPFFTCTMPNYTEFTALYDQYRIDWVECEFFFNSNSSTTGSPSVSLPIMYVAKDYDDVATAGVAALQQYNNVQTWQLGEQSGRQNGKYTINVKPNVDMALFQGVTTGYARGKPMFIDTGSPSVPHYGIKMAFDPIFTPAASTVVGYLSINFKYHMTMNATK